MYLNKLFGSNTKTDILKYLLFRREGISLRGLETSIDWTFPAIKSQITSLEQSKIVEINKKGQKRSITVSKNFGKHLKNIFLESLKLDIKNILSKHINKNTYNYYFGKLFGYDMQMDLVIIYDDLSEKMIKKIKIKIGKLCMLFFISNISITCMSNKEWQQRYRLADKFVLSIMNGIDDQK